MYSTTDMRGLVELVLRLKELLVASQALISYSESRFATWTVLLTDMVADLFTAVFRVGQYVDGSVVEVFQRCQPAALVVVLIVKYCFLY